jgi:hypothetical protein
MSEILNKVEQSGLTTIDLEEWYPKSQFSNFDIGDYLFKGLILKEKDFREALEQINWEVYKNSVVLVYCSADAIIPQWAYMLVGSKLANIAVNVFFGNLEDYLKSWYRIQIDKFDISSFADKRIVIKGCADKEIPSSAFLRLSFLLTPIVKSLMFGEPCSTVPIFKKKKN